MGLESKYTVPLVGVSSAASRCRSVLFPAPEGATIATISPSASCRFTSARIVSCALPEPYTLRSPRASRTTRPEVLPLVRPSCASVSIVAALPSFISSALPCRDLRNLSPLYVLDAPHRGGVMVRSSCSRPYQTRNFPRQARHLHTFPNSLPLAQCRILKQI